LDDVFADAQGIGTILNNVPRRLHGLRIHVSGFGQVRFEQDLQTALQVKPEAGGDVTAEENRIVEGVEELDLITEVDPYGQGSHNDDESQAGVKVSDHALGISIHKNVALWLRRPEDVSTIVRHAALIILPSDNR
jgi:hypothetical protein